ncbi:MAG: hypothetical protein M1312_01075 [Patescibacteria group bacterium]|nr:hypothetical protein [Patescibacteria group bacterium]
MEETGLSARELLTEALNNLQLRLKGTAVELPKKVLAEIADDSDWHRSRTGYTGYKSAIVVKCGGKRWAIALGIKCGGYPADPYNCDIAAVPLSSNGEEAKLAEEISAALKRNSYFRHSLIYAMDSGELAACSYVGCLGQRVLDFLRPRIREFIARDLKIDPTIWTMDLRPVVRSTILYKRELVAFLSENFQTILS